MSGTEIRGEAEILALAERYVAMITKRAYRKRMNITEARKLIVSLADGKFRPAIPRALLSLLTDYPSTPSPWPVCQSHHRPQGQSLQRHL